MDQGQWIALSIGLSTVILAAAAVIVSIVKWLTSVDREELRLLREKFDKAKVDLADCKDDCFYLNKLLIRAGNGRAQP